ASGTIHTFQLGAVANVYSCRTDMYTLQTIYTIAMAKGLPVFVFPKFFPAAFAFATFVVVSHNNRFIVQKHTLQPAVRTGNNTYLFSKPGKHKIEYRRKNEQRNQSAHMLKWPIDDVSQQFVATNDVGQ